MKINKKFISVFVCLSFMGSSLFSAITSEQEALLKELPADQRVAMQERMKESQELSEDIEEAFKRESFLVERPELKEEEEEKNKCEECIYGYDLFRFSPSTFAPVNIVPISFSYILGPGDELTVNLYGANQENNTAFIQRDGTFNLPLLGPINLAGYTFAEAQEVVKKDFKEINEKLEDAGEILNKNNTAILKGIKSKKTKSFYFFAYYCSCFLICR